LAGFTLIKIFSDTNIIHAAQAHLLLPAKISEYIAEHKKIESVEVKWLLPKMVVSERRHQMLLAAKALNPKIAELEKLLGHNLGFNDDVLAERIDSKINKVIVELGIDICDIDSSSVDWDELIDRSAKRMPPFEISGDKEKGFRDAIIATTFLQQHKKSPVTARACLLIFISGDERLREYVQEKTAEAKNVRILDSLDELKSLLNSIASEISEEYLNEISAKAKLIFYDFSKNEGLYSSSDVIEGIFAKFSTEIEKINAAFPESRSKLESVIIGEQTFIKKIGQTVFWSHEIILKFQILVGGNDTLVNPAAYAAILGGRLLGDSLLGKAASVERIVSYVTTTFAVEWQHQITTKGNISKPKINSIDFIGHTFSSDK